VNRLRHVWLPATPRPLPPQEAGWRTVDQVAEVLGVTGGRVRQLLLKGEALPDAP
jgi:hypothetical protein